MSASEDGVVRIAGKLIRFLRSGVKLELGANAEIIAAQATPDTHLKTYYRALARFDAARALLKEIGVSDQREPQDVEARSRALADATAEGAGVSTRPRTHPARGCPRGGN